MLDAILNNQLKNKENSILIERCQTYLSTNDL